MPQQDDRQDIRNLIINGGTRQLIDTPTAVILEANSNEPAKRFEVCRVQKRDNGGFYTGHLDTHQLGELVEILLLELRFQGRVRR